MTDQVVLIQPNADLFFGNLRVIKGTVCVLGTEKLFMQHSKSLQVSIFPRLWNQLEKISNIFSTYRNPISQTSYLIPIKAHQYPPIDSSYSPREGMQIKTVVPSKEYVAADSAVNTCDRKNRGLGVAEGEMQDTRLRRPLRLPQGFRARRSGEKTLISGFQVSKGSQSMAGPSTHVTVRSSTGPSLKFIYEKLVAQFKETENVSRHEGGQT